MESLALSLATSRVRWNWILDCRSDLIWYIGSAVVGWIYVGLILFLGQGLGNPLQDPLYTLNFGDRSISLTLELAIFASWAYLVDSPHLWATLARTYLDPDEWSERRRELLFSLIWFVVGPVAVLGPYLVGTVVPMDKATMALGGQLFYAFFRLWAYYHVVRQHWGFFVLYKRKNGDFSDPMENRADFWLFNLSLYLPVLSYISAPGQSKAGFVDVEFVPALLGAPTITGIFHELSLALYGAVIVGYLMFQLWRWHLAIPRNGPKLLFLLSIVPLHFVVFSNPLLALFAVPIVTVGHNLQYHRIVWMYGQNKYARDVTERYRLTQPIFRHLWLYLLLGVIFTFSLSRGPWIDLFEEKAALYFDRWLFSGIGMMAGIMDPATAGVGAEVVALFLTGWSLHHYYLDSKIWRVSKDQKIAKSLDL